MASNLAPTGLRPVARFGNEPFNGGYTTYPLTSDNNVVLAVGDPVALVGGTIAPVSASPVAGTLSANTPIGIVMGFEYMDPARGFVTRAWLPATAITAGLTNIKVLVNDDPFARMTVEASGSVPQSALGSTIALKNFGAASTANQTSRVQADATTVSNSSGSTGALKIIGFVNDPQNAPGDAYTKLLVQWNTGAHYFGVAGAH